MNVRENDSAEISGRKVQFFRNKCTNNVLRSLRSFAFFIHRNTTEQQELFRTKFMHDCCLRFSVACSWSSVSRLASLLSRFPIFSWASLFRQLWYVDSRWTQSAQGAAQLIGVIGILHSAWVHFMHSAQSDFFNAWRWHFPWHCRRLLGKELLTTRLPGRIQTGWLGNTPLCTVQEHWAILVITAFYPKKCHKYVQTFTKEIWKIL